jgi:hypothetical protein
VTSRWARRLAAFGLAWCAGCGVAAPDIEVADRCNLGSIPVLLEQGVAASASLDCASYASALGEYRQTFVESWGAVALEEEQWTLRVRAGAVAVPAGHTGVTYHHSRVVDIAEAALETLPHELRHVQLGRGSDDHHGWCSNFAPWEERVLGVDERAYLGCER